uniref:Secreted protein n=1 Tax=Anopheles atroparvus TaxID=41427 RepID=A0AAG5DTQ6_ANOAO
MYRKVPSSEFVVVCVPCLALLDGCECECDLLLTGMCVYMGARATRSPFRNGSKFRFCQFLQCVLKNGFSDKNNWTFFFSFAFSKQYF